MAFGSLPAPAHFSAAAWNSRGRLTDNAVALARLCPTERAWAGGVRHRPRWCGQRYRGRGRRLSTAGRGGRRDAVAGGGFPGLGDEGGTARRRGRHRHAARLGRQGRRDESPNRHDRPADDRVGPRGRFARPTADRFRRDHSARGGPSRCRGGALPASGSARSERQLQGDGPPGRYAATAVETFEQGRQFVPEVQARLKERAKMFSIDEGGTATLDLPLTSGVE